MVRPPIPKNGALACALGVAALVACNGILGTPDPVARVEKPDGAGLDAAAEAGDAACRPTLALPPGACASCVAASCCEEGNACADHPACASYEACALGCQGDATCREACLAKLPVPTNDDMPRLEHCVVASCAAACGISCGVTVFPQQPDIVKACESCLVDHACDPANACGASLDCQELEWCVFTCATPDCQRACEAAHPDGVAKFTSLYAAIGSACTICNRDGYWQCVGKVSWPLAKSDHVAVTLTITDSSSGAVPDLVVKACDRIDTACASPHATGTTDAQGNVTLDLPTFAPAFGFSGFFDISGGDIPPYLYFLSFPLSEPSASLNLIVASQARFAELASQVVRTQPDGGTTPFTPDPTRGTVAITATDCLLFGAGGVAFTAASGTDSSTLLRYYDGQSASNTATSSDRSGLAFFFDVPAGPQVTIHAVPAAIGRDSSVVTVFVRPGGISYVQAFPSP
jgi:hypothetical protein